MRSIIKAVIRIIIIFIMINCLNVFLRYFLQIFRESYTNSQYKTIPDLTAATGYIFAFLGVLLLLSIVWWKADSLAGLVAGKSDDQKLRLEVSGGEFFKIALIFLGIFLLVNSIPVLLGSIGYQLASEDQLLRDTLGRAQLVQIWAVPIVSLVIGAALVLGTKKQWWKTGFPRKENNMMHQTRPFSITAISLAGFEFNKTYPVLAIRMDRQLVSVVDETNGEPRGKNEYQNIALFLVGDDNGEFSWIAEVDCKLAALQG